MIGISRPVMMGIAAVGVASACAWAAYTITGQADTIGEQRQQLIEAQAQFTELEMALAEAERARQVEVTALNSALAEYRAESARAQQQADQLQRTLTTERGRNDAFNNCMDMPVPDAVLERLRF